MILSPISHRFVSAMWRCKIEKPPRPSLTDRNIEPSLNFIVKLIPPERDALSYFRPTVKTAYFSRFVTCVTDDTRTTRYDNSPTMNCNGRLMKINTPESLYLTLTANCSKWNADAKADTITRQIATVKRSFRMAL